MDIQLMVRLVFNFFKPSYRFTAAPQSLHLQKQGLNVQDFGTNNSASVDYPDFAHPVANAVERGEAGCGILICGSANGVAISANKHQGIRAAICWMEELAQLARQ